jgi:trehalose 6-phosphate phosphatase
MRWRPSLRARLKAIPPRRLILFLDYDGTLTPIVRRPAEARLKTPVKQALSRLARCVPVVIVSGRTLSDLRRRVGVAGIRYVAHHGLVYKEPGSAVQWLGQRISRREVREWVKALRSVAQGVPGALVEDKGLGVALHDRLVRPSDRARLRRQALLALAPWVVSQKAVLLHGKRVLEVRPAGAWNKGTAVATLLQRPWAVGRVPVYFGDDRTDVDAFRVLRGRGITVGIGGRRGIAGAETWVSGPKAVESFLRWLGTRQKLGAPPRSTRAKPNGIVLRAVGEAIHS